MKIQCPQCTQHIEADDQWAGQNISCPTCKAEFRLPGPIAPPPLAALPPIYTPQHPPRNSNKHAAFIWGGIIAVLLLAVLNAFMPEKGSTGTVSSEGAVVPSHQQAKMRAAIERVLQQDRGTNTGASSVGEIVPRMRAIETSECPNDFRAAYLAHIHAWESMGQVEQQARAFKADREGAGDVVEGFIRGFLGDPMGKANEIQDAQNQLQRAYQSASQQVKQTFNQVEEMAVAYGASLPQR